MGHLFSASVESDTANTFEVASYEIGYNHNNREVLVSYFSDTQPPFYVRMPDAMALDIVAKYLRKRICCLH